MLISFALKPELKDLFSRINIREMVRFTKSRYLYIAEHRGIVFYLLRTGVGPGAVSQGLNSLPSSLSISRIMNVGTCGLLNDDREPGVLLMPDEIVSTWHSNVFFPDSSGIALSRVQRCVSVGKSENSEEFRENLIRKYHAQIVDMESWSILAWAYERNIPVTVVKAVSDFAGENTGFDVQNNMKLCSQNISDFLLNE